MQSEAHRFHAVTRYMRLREPDGSSRYVMGEDDLPGPAIGEQLASLEPHPTKRYVDLPVIPLPSDTEFGTLPALTALLAGGKLDGPSDDLSLPVLAHLLRKSNGLLKRWSAPGGKEVWFRAAGCTGARYHLEVYVVCGDLPGLPAGVYHYGVDEHCLRMIRPGDWRGALVEAAGGEIAVAGAPATLVCSSEFWRNAWRYQARAWRHAFWDLGTLLTNVVAESASAGIASRVVMGFADGAVNALVGIDGEREAALALVPLGDDAAAPVAAAVPTIAPVVLPSSSAEITFPDIPRIQRATALKDGAAAEQWRTCRASTLTDESGPSVKLSPLTAPTEPTISIDEAIQQRRSNRHYDTEKPLPFALFSTALTRALAPVEIDALPAKGPALFDLYVIVNSVDGLAQGLYVVDRGHRSLVLLREGDFRAEAARIAVDQEYASHAHANIYALTDLDRLVQAYGDRGYRLAQFAAAIAGGKVQLAAHALGLGAVGSTSIDDEVTDLFAPHAEGKSFMFVAVIGPKRRPNAAETERATTFLREAALVPDPEATSR